MNTQHNLRPEWCRGQLVVFSGLDGPTSYEDGLSIRTKLEPAGLEVMEPGRCRLDFAEPPQGDVLFATDHFSFRSGKGTVQAAMLDAHHLLIGCNCAVATSHEAIEVLRQDGRTLVGVKAKFQPDLIRADLARAFEARAHWLANCAGPADATARTERTLQRALSMMKGQVYSPEGAIRRRWTTPDRWPHKDMWLWDSAFHAIGWRHWDVALAREMLDAVFDIQRADGFIPHRMSPRGIVSDFTQPPVLAFAVKLVQETEAQRDWLERLYPKLEAYIEWDLAHRDTDGGGLVEWFIEETPECRSGESGMDNSPRFDAALQLDAVDFNSFLAYECEILAGFARELGREADAGKWTSRYQRLVALINDKLWSPEAKFYCDYDPTRRERTPILSSAGFLPLLCGAASPEQAKCLARHLADPDMFATSFPVPSIAVRDWKHYAKDMWRGPTWISMNWLIARGFARYGMHDHAESLRSATMLEVERTCEKFGTFFEYFDDRREVEPPQLLRKGILAPEKDPYRQVIHEFGWTATLYADLAMETAAKKSDP